MTYASLHKLQMTAQEFEALLSIIRQTFTAFKATRYENFFEYFLMHLVQIIEVGFFVTRGAEWVISFDVFDKKYDELDRFMSEAHLFRVRKSSSLFDKVETHRNKYNKEQPPDG